MGRTAKPITLDVMPAMERRRLEAAHAELAFWGTPEKAYTDSGLFKYLQYVKTKDEGDQHNPVKPFPLMPYILATFMWMLACPTIAIPKSRQIRISWMMAVFGCWLRFRRAHSCILYQTETFDKACDMVSQGAGDPDGGRMSFIECNLPDWLSDPKIRKGDGNRQGQVVGSNSSRIIALAQGGSKVRQYTPTAMFCDEAAFQVDFPEAYTAIQPALSSGGRLIMASSAEASFFGRLREPPSSDDEYIVDLETMGDPNDPMSDHSEDMVNHLRAGRIVMPNGMRFYRSKHGINCLDINYRADPNRDPVKTEAGRLWVKAQAKRYLGGLKSVEWAREMEGDWEASGGNPVFPDLIDPTSPVYIPCPDATTIITQHEIFAGYDHGFPTNSAFEVMSRDKQGNVYTIFEIKEPCENYKRMAAAIKACPYFKYLKGPIVCDHSMVNRTQRNQDGGVGNLVALFAEEGVIMVPGRKGADYGFVMRLRGSYWADPKAPRFFITDATPGIAHDWRNLRWEPVSSEAVGKRRDAPQKIMHKDQDTFDACAYVMDHREPTQTAPKRYAAQNSVERILESIRAKNRKDEREGYLRAR